MFSSHLLTRIGRDKSEIPFMGKDIMFSQKFQKTAAGSCESATRKLNYIYSRNRELHAYLTGVITSMEQAANNADRSVDVRREELNRLSEEAYVKINEYEDDSRVADEAQDILSESLTCLQEWLKSPEANMQDQGDAQIVQDGIVLPRQMRAVPGVNQDESPCSTFPEGGDDLLSIIAHLNDVISKGGLPAFGKAALVNQQSAARAACVRNGLNAEWFRQRSNLAYTVYLDEIEGGRNAIEISDFQASRGNFVYSFFNRHREKMPQRVQSVLNESGKTNVQTVSNRTIAQMPGTSSAFDVVGITLLCRLVNLLQGGDEDATAHMFAYVVDKRRRELGVNEFAQDEYDSARALGEVDPEKRGLDVVPDSSATTTSEDFAANIHSGIEQLQSQAPTQYNDKAIRILEGFKNDVAIKLDTHIGSLSSILDKLSIEAIGAEQMKSQQAAVEPMRNILQQSLEDATNARNRIINGLDALIDVAQRGHSIPALIHLKSLFGRKKTAYVNHNHAQIVITTESGEINEGIRVLTAIVRANRANPPLDWTNFAPDDFERSDLHSLQQAQPRALSKKEEAKRRCRYVLVHTLAPRISGLPFEDKVQEIKGAINSEEMAKCMMQLLKDNTNRTVERIPARGPNEVQLIYQKLKQDGGIFNPAAWIASLTNADPQEQKKLDNALVAAFDRATNRYKDKYNAARVIAGLAWQLNQSVIINNEEAVALMNFIGEEPDIKSWRDSGLGTARRAREQRMAFIDDVPFFKEAGCSYEDVRDYMLKLARSLFLA